MKILSAAILAITLASVAGAQDQVIHGDGSKLAPDKCTKQYEALNQANDALNRTKAVIRGLPRMIPGVPPPMDEPKQLVEMRQSAVLSETQAAMVYEQARADYMACEGTR